jgi:hypothetical protein
MPIPAPPPTPQLKRAPPLSTNTQPSQARSNLSTNPRPPFERVIDFGHPHNSRYQTQAKAKAWAQGKQHAQGREPMNITTRLVGPAGDIARKERTDVRCSIM